MLLHGGFMNHCRYQKEIKKWEPKRVCQGLTPLRATLGPALQAEMAEGEGMARKEQRGAHPRDGERWPGLGCRQGPAHTSPV